MNSNTYYILVQFLTDHILSNKLNKDKQKKIKNKAQYFIVVNRLLYKRNKKEPTQPFKVVKHNEVKTILYNLHSDPLAGHFGIDETFRRTALQYYWPQIFEDI